MTPAETVIDAEVVEAGTDLAVAESAAPTLFRTDDPVEVLTRATEVADALAPAIEQRKLYANISGKKHITVEGWTTLGAMLGVTPVCLWTRKLDDGWEARVEAHTLDGRLIGAAEAQCTRAEKMWAKRDDYALRSMAQTRATSKALGSVLRFVVTLAGYSGTPAEEVQHDGGQSFNKSDDDEFSDNVLPPGQIFPATIHAARWWENPKTSESKLIVEVVVANSNGGKPARETIWISPTRREMTQLSSVCNGGEGIAPQSDVSHLVGRPLTITVELNGKYRNHTIGAPA